MLISGSCLRPDRDGAALLRGAAPHRRDLFRALEPPRIAARDEARTAETPRGKGDRACGSALHPSPPPLPASSSEPLRHPPSGSSHPAGTIPKPLVVIVNGFGRHRVLKRFGRHPPQPSFA